MGRQTEAGESESDGRWIALKSHSHVKFLLSLIALGAFYAISGKLCLRLAYVHPSASSIWVPTGIALAAFLTLGYRVWPAIFAGAFWVNITTSGSIAACLGIALGNTLEGLVGAYLVNHVARGRNAFERSWDVIQFFLVAALLSTMLSPTLGITSLALWGFAPWTRYALIWRVWWCGDIGGALIVAPLLLLWNRRYEVKWTSTKILEGVSLALCATFFALAIFGGIFLPQARIPLGYICFIPVIWAAYRFGPRETAFTVFITCVITTWGTLHGFGPFVRSTPNGSLLFVSLYMDVLALTGLFLAAEMLERRQDEAALQHARNQLELRVQERTISLERTINDLTLEITERLQTERTLRESQERFQLLVQAVKDYAIYMLDPDGYVISWNAGAERIKGYRAEDIIGQHFSVFYPKEDASRGKPARELETARAEGRAEDVGLRVRKDGSTFWADVVLTALFDASGRLRGFVKVTRDITERKEAEKKIHVFQDIVNNTQIGIVVLQLENLQDEKSLRVISANPAASQVAGVPMGSVVGKMLWNEFPQLFKSPLPNRLAEVARSGKSFDFGEFPYSDTRVREGVFMVKAFPLPDHCIGVTFENITDRKQAEKALTDSEGRFWQLVDSNIIGFMLLDGQERVLEVNGALAKLLGYTHEELTLSSITMPTLTPESFHPIDQWMQERLAASGMCPPIEKEFIRKDGARIPVLVGMVELQGTNHHRLCFVIDVSERRVAQDAMRKAYDELERRVQQRTAELQEEILRRQHAEEELRNQAIHDSLTGLYNRRGFRTMTENQLQLAKRQKTPLLLFMADLDDLKKINDKLGHAEGDYALTRVGELLRKTFRQSDIIARIGGDEFAITGIEEPGQTGNHLVERLAKVVDDYNRYSGRPYRIRLSIGTARIDPQSTQPLEHYIQQADAMLYEDKKRKGSIEPTSESQAAENR